MKRSKHSLSHYKLFSCDMGELVPAACFEVLPGDTVQGATSMLIRMAPMLAPVMHPTHARVHWWYVPYRLIWDDFENFITGGPDGANASVYPTVAFAAGGPEIGTLADYLGYPVDVAAGYSSSALPFRAYAKIWNEWYRDQDLQTELVIDTTSGADTTTNVLLQKVNWEKDYFTSSRPWEQKGPQVSIPLTGNAPVRGLAGAQALVYNQNATGYADSVMPDPPGTNWTGDTPSFKLQGNNTTKILSLHADLSAVSGVTINDLREALAIQRFEEARARYGSRFVEYLRYLGVRSSDARLQRPEYLGGGKQTLQFSEVLQTAPDATTGFVGTTRGHGIGAMRSRRFRRFFEEHGVVLALVSVKPRTMYYQGSKRSWNRRVKEDFWQKELEHIGQQEVLNKELYQSHATPEGVFGYQDRYDEYRREENSVAGEFRANTLDYWHMGRLFSSDPALNSTFVTSTPTERIFASASTDVLYVMAMHAIQARRLVSKVGTSFTF